MRKSSGVRGARQPRNPLLFLRTGPETLRGWGAGVWAQLGRGLCRRPVLLPRSQGPSPSNAASLVTVPPLNPLYVGALFTKVESIRRRNLCLISAAWV